MFFAESKPLHFFALCFIIIAKYFFPQFFVNLNEVFYL